MWYLVEIQSINTRTRQAKCVSNLALACTPWSGVAFLRSCLARPQAKLQQRHNLGAECRIQYTSGEVEELDLEEIIREGHMSLITS